MARLYFIRHSPPEGKDVQLRKCLCDICVSHAVNAGLAEHMDKKGSEMMDAVDYECTVLAAMVITFKERNNIIFQEIKRLSSNPDLTGSKNATGKYKAAFAFQL